MLLGGEGRVITKMERVVHTCSLKAVLGIGEG